MDACVAPAPTVGGSYVLPNVARQSFVTADGLVHKYQIPGGPDVGKSAERGRAADAHTGRVDDHRQLQHRIP